MNDQILLSTSRLLSNHFQKEIIITGSKPVGGGCISNACSIQTSEGEFFVKYQYHNHFPGMFESEAAGLNQLKRTNTVSVPEVIVFQQDTIILELLVPGKKKSDAMADAGRKLASLHKVTSGKFGLNYDNYIGSLPQSNREHIKFTEFFTRERLLPMINLAGSNMPAGMIRSFEKLFMKLNELIPIEPSSLVHGDLWNGNMITGPDGKYWLIDPAVHFSFRETDLAMTKLFGGFDDSFYSGYNEIYPLQNGWETRTEILQLYPLLVHLNLFGKSYLPAISNIVTAYT